MPHRCHTYEVSRKEREREEDDGNKGELSPKEEVRIGDQRKRL